ncbi:type I-F CRISPR-associated endonuclease Cas1f [Suttonella sp. R2A3]|uniref:type I-F CRISPR-associated endonuclease Cas1f n=1 Tax=Suttonella sp. R2A3 TaxID=2908648 RepID=UPI001F29AAE4|nr:type I-F CRISPR-associated endonuclease Cas1f [Suttonella sp. R2A3]UJF25014.1 type I-F CRISPR-associated endonuclease Cas1f [Suttonella sp. R2A3]
MNQAITSADLKTILHSKRANIYYLEHCRVMQKDGRVLYLTEAEKENHYYNIPIANTTCILLATGTSITQAAMRMLASAGVLVGFCGGGGTPLLMATEIQWLCPQSEYRPTEYVQGWLSWWFNDSKRLQAAKLFQHARLDFLTHVWQKDRELKAEGFNIAHLTSSLDEQRAQISLQNSTMNLLQLEARLTKQLYKFAATQTKQMGFSRNHEGLDKANAFLNHGNYLAYGLGATTAWVLGIPHGFAVMHGKTRRGALVFDIADLIKDALVLPTAFICAKENASEQAFRQQCLQIFTKHNVLDYMFDVVKAVALKTDWTGDKDVPT